MNKIFVWVALAAAITTVPLRANVITFDDLSDGGYGTPIANGYQGLNWNNFYVLNTSNYGPSGYVNGTVSPNNVAFNGYGTEAIISNGSFVLNSAYFTAAWNDGLNIEVQGFLGGNPVGDVNFTVNTQTPVLETFNWTVDTVNFISSGGTNHGYNGAGTHFAMDNLTINETVPEPSSLAGLAGIFAVCLAALRRKRANLTI